MKYLPLWFFSLSFFSLNKIESSASWVVTTERKVSGREPSWVRLGARKEREKSPVGPDSVQEGRKGHTALLVGFWREIGWPF